MNYNSNKVSAEWKIIINWIIHYLDSYEGNLPTFVCTFLLRNFCCCPMKHYRLEVLHLKEKELWLPLIILFEAGTSPERLRNNVFSTPFPLFVFWVHLLSREDKSCPADFVLQAVRKRGDAFFSINQGPIWLLLALQLSLFRCSFL